MIIPVDIAGPGSDLLVGRKRKPQIGNLAERSRNRNRNEAAINNQAASLSQGQTAEYLLCDRTHPVPLPDRYPESKGTIVNGGRY